MADPLRLVIEVDDREAKRALRDVDTAVKSVGTTAADTGKQLDAVAGVANGANTKFALLAGSSGALRKAGVDLNVTLAQTVGQMTGLHGAAGLARTSMVGMSGSAVAMTSVLAGATVAAAGLVAIAGKAVAAHMELSGQAARTEVAMGRLAASWERLQGAVGKALVGDARPDRWIDAVSVAIDRAAPKMERFVGWLAYIARNSQLGDIAQPVNALVSGLSPTPIDIGGPLRGPGALATNTGLGQNFLGASPNAALRFLELQNKGNDALVESTRKAARAAETFGEALRKATAALMPDVGLGSDLMHPGVAGWQSGILGLQGGMILGTGRPPVTLPWLPGVSMDPNDWAERVGGIPGTLTPWLPRPVGPDVTGSVLGPRPNQSFGAMFGGNILSALPSVLMSAFTGGGNMGQSLGGLLGGSAGSAIAGLGSGAVGSMLGGTLGSILPGIGTLAGGLLGKLFGGLFGPSKEAKADKAATGQIQQYEQQLLSVYGSLDKIRAMGDLVGVGLAGAWGDKSQAGLKNFTALMNEFITKTDALQSALDKYGLSWEALGEKAQQFYTNQKADELIADFHTLIDAGAKYDTVIAAMASEFSALVQSAMRTGVALPAAMQPMLQSLVDMGLLLDELGNKIETIDDWTFKDKTIDVSVAYHDDGYAPPADYAYGAGGGFVTASGIQYLAGGGPVGARGLRRGSDTVPAMLTPGEGVLSRDGMRALGKLNRGDSGVGGAHIHFHGGTFIGGDREQLARDLGDIAYERWGRATSFGGRA